MRLTKVELSDFRGFPGPKNYEFDLGPLGKNLLLYGENGSGKPSLFVALREMLNLNPEADGFREFKNRFSGTDTFSRVDGTVRLCLQNGASLEWTYLKQRPLEQEFVVDAARRKACLDYRALLRTNFVEGSLEERLFQLAVEVLLFNVPVTLAGGVERRLGEFWKDVVASKPPYRYPYMVERAERAVNSFNLAFRAVLPDVEREVQRLLKYFGDPWIEIALDFPGISFSKKEKDFLQRQLNLKVCYRGRDLTNHETFLNEARLSALALALYFASAKLSNPAPPPGGSIPLKLLVLDDVLIGLDMAHRLPVLDLLQAEFLSSGWQVFLLTFDRTWYDVARQHLRNEAWVFSQLYNVNVGNHEQPVLVKDDDHLERALAFVSDGEIKAAAVHIRTEFELTLKRACAALRIPVRYEPDPRKLQASELWDALKSAKFEFQPAERVKYDAKGRLHTWPQKKRLIPYLGGAIVRRVEHSVSWVLNPLNHSQALDLYRAEIEDAIFMVDELRAFVEIAINGDLCGLMREQRASLVGLLRKRLEGSEG